MTGELRSWHSLKPALKSNPALGAATEVPVDTSADRG
jgi:hypothetical protein